MNSNLIHAALIVLALPVGAQIPVNQDSPREFVQGFYDWYVPITKKDHKKPAFTIALARKGSVFSPELARALREDADAQDKAKGEIVGIDWDPFLNGQDSERKYEVGAVNEKEGRFFVGIHGVRAGKRHSKPSVVAELMKINGQWTFVDFRWLDGKSLLYVLKTLSKERQSSPR